jgi:hypothetical protein
MLSHIAVGDQAYHRHVVTRSWVNREYMRGLRTTPEGPRERKVFSLRIPSLVMSLEGTMVLNSDLYMNSILT